MSSFELELVFPPTCYTDSQHHAQDVAALAGHVTLLATSPVVLTDVTQLNVQLIQRVTSMSGSKATRRLSCPLFCLSKNDPSRPNVTSERIIQDIPLPTPSEDELRFFAGKSCFKSSFCLDIPENIPATTKTSLGTVTYAIEATAVTSDNETVTQCRPVDIIRDMIHNDLSKTQHYLNFPNSSDIHGMTLSQNSTPRSGPRISFTAILHTHWETAPADRPTEISHLVVRELRWQAEEIVKVMSKPGDIGAKHAICDQHSLHRLCGGVVKGYWGSNCNPYIRQQDSQYIDKEAEEKPKIRIPFVFSIPKRAMVTDAIDLAAYEAGSDEVSYSPKCDLTKSFSGSSLGTSEKAITVHHQLRIELLTGEDVFHRHTGKLVERKRVRTVVCPAVPLIVCEVSI